MYSNTGTGKSRAPLWNKFYSLKKNQDPQDNYKKMYTPKATKRF